MKHQTKLMKSLLLVGSLVMFIGMNGCVTTQKDIDPMRSDLSLLRQQLTKTQEEMATMKDDIQKQNDKQLGTFKTDLEAIQKNQADAKVATEKNTSDITITNNRVDEYNDRMNKLEQKIGTMEQSLTQKLDVQKAENQKKFDALEQKIGSGGVPVPANTDNQSTTLSSASTAPLEIVDPKQLYQTAEQDYLKGQYELSVKETKDYIQRFPEGTQIGQAHFLLAQNYIAQQKNDDALTELNTFITTYPNDDKIPSAMLKRAFIFKQLKKNTEYQDELKAIVKKYPLSPEAEQALDELKSSGK